jgi:adenylyltransferase/sulfurtransferase
MINDACVLLNKPLVYGAVLRFEGQVSVFNVINKETGIKTHYRDLFPMPPDAASSLSCSEAGVLGVLPGIIGTLQATEAIKLITGVGQPLANTLLTYNALHNTFYDIRYGPNENATVNMPADEAGYKAYNYEVFCNAYTASEITGKQLDAMIAKGSVTIVDVREAGEQPLLSRFTVRQMPLSTLANQLAEAHFASPVVVFCQTGKRSLKALQMMQAAYPALSFFSVKGGVEGMVEA